MRDTLAARDSRRVMQIVRNASGHFRTHTHTHVRPVESGPREAAVTLHAISMMRVVGAAGAMGRSRRDLPRVARMRSERFTMSDTTSPDDRPVLELLARMTADSVESSSLDPETLVLVRVAALVAVDAAPVSYALNLKVGSLVGLDVESLRGVLTAIAPIVGTAKVAAATGNIVRALAAEVALEELEIAELEDEYEDEDDDADR